MHIKFLFGGHKVTFVKVGPMYSITGVTVGPVLLVLFNYCVLSFARETANVHVLIAVAAHEAHKVCYK